MTFPTLRRLTIIVPVYNEKATIAALLTRVAEAPLPPEITREIIVVDDASTDGTTDVLRELVATQENLKLCVHPVNVGKGAALRTGFTHATGDWILIQDADFEYDPQDYIALCQPILDGTADGVYGSRFVSGQRVTERWHAAANRLLTWFSNRMTGLRLTDMECCYKLIPRSALGRIRLCEKRFGFEPEITAKLARLGLRITEVPVCAITVALTPRARKSAGAMPSALCAASCATACETTRRHPMRCTTLSTHKRGVE